MKKHPLFFAALILLGSIGIVGAGSVQSLIIDFHRELIEAGNREEAAGTIYFCSPQDLTVIVREPLTQWMVFGKKKLEIYYPDEEKAFRFTSEYPFQLSFFQAFVGVLNKDYGLSDLGYVLVQRSVNADTITTIWKPPKSLAKLLGEFFLVYCQGRIIRAESRTPKGAALSRCTFGNHFEFDEVFFPLQITAIRFFESDSSIESVTFSEPQFNCEIPQEIAHFTIPPTTDVEETEW
jgi:outer membrane lipoprotein-sorting protein